MGVTKPNKIKGFNSVCRNNSMWQIRSNPRKSWSDKKSVHENLALQEQREKIADHKYSVRDKLSSVQRTPKGLKSTAKMLQIPQKKMSIQNKGIKISAE